MSIRDGHRQFEDLFDFRPVILRQVIAAQQKQAGNTHGEA